MKFLLISFILFLIGKEFIIVNEEFFIIVSFFIVFFSMYFALSNVILSELSSKSYQIKQSIYNLYNSKYNYIILLLQFYFFLVFWFSFFFKNIKKSILDLNSVKINYFYVVLDFIVTEYVYFLLEYYLNKLFENVQILFVLTLGDYFGILSNSDKTVSANVEYTRWLDAVNNIRFQRVHNPLAKIFNKKSI